uniref:NADH-ubiquinone oxidoreductase chain 2 n=1 Tax=Tridacna gigas TaxID=80829 RepID=A0A7G8QBA0_TRIGG|nr:NADH dehydrogenase subunit 2 [Tridacna gigas]QNK04058.1 NADH dehydrogenase subunit 2 [Tridacna gigas]
MAVTSKGVMGALVGMEIIFFGVMPLMLLTGIKKDTNLNEAEAALVYFVFQSMGSMFLFLSLVLLMFHSFQSLLIWLMFVLGMTMKLGLFPFHTWVVTVTGMSSWLGVLFVLVMMKLAPYWMLSGIGLPTAVASLFILLSCVTTMLGSIGACNQATLRGVLGYSSLSQSGFMMSLSLVNVYYYLWYFSVYSAVMSMLLVSCWRKDSSFLVMVSLASLSGVPPLMGMYMKFGGLYCLSGTSVALCVFLVVWSLFGFFYYFNALVEMFYLKPNAVNKHWGFILVNSVMGPVMVMGLMPLM